MSILRKLILNLPFVKAEVDAIATLVNVENTILREEIKRKDAEIVKLKQTLKKYGA